jgi:RNA polymerase sigma-70 factor (ECF subfamily)
MAARRPLPIDPAGLAAASDGEVAVHAMHGSEAAAREIVRRYERPVFSLIDRLVREPPVSEELAQDTFLKIFRKLHTFDPRLRLSAWILRIAHHTAIDHLRRHRPALVSLDAEDERGGAPLGERLADETVLLPDRLLEQDRTAEALERALARIRPEYRSVLVLRYQEGLDYDEIAGVIDRPLGTVKTFLHRARRALAQALAETGRGSVS